MDSDIKWKNIQRILTRTKKSSKIKVQSKKRKEKGRNADGCRERKSVFFACKKGGNKMKRKTMYFVSSIAIVLIAWLLLGKNTYAAVSRDYFTTTEYKIVTEKEKLLTGLNPNNMQADTILSGLHLHSQQPVLEKRAFQADGTQVTGKTTLGTGSYIQAIYQGGSNWFTSYETLYLVLYGDTNGDGKIAATDALAIIKNRTGKVPFANNYVEEAGRITSGTRKNGSVPSATDALAIIKYRLGNTTITQTYDKQVTINTYDELYTQMQQNNTNLKFGTTEEAKKVQADYTTLKNIVSTYCKEDMTDVIKALVLHDYLVAGTKYKIGLVTDSTLPESNIGNINKTLNTNGFAYAYSCLLGIAGVPNKVRMDKYGTLANELEIDGETYYAFCGYDSNESEEQGKGEALRLYFLRNDANSPLELETPNKATSDKYRGATWPKYRKALDYKDSEIKTVKGKIFVTDMKGIYDAIEQGKDYAVDAIDRHSYEVKEIDERCRRIVAKYIKPEMTTIEKILTIHDYICSNFMRNDSEAIKERKISSKDYDCAWGTYKDVVVANVGACWASTDYFNTLCSYVGIETQEVTVGQIDNPYNVPGGVHKWSLVKVDGQWYHVDCEGSDFYHYGTVDRTWLLKSDQAMHITNNTYEPCTSTKYDNYDWPEYKGLAYYQDVTGIIDEEVPATSLWIDDRSETTVGNTYNLRAIAFPYGTSRKLTYTSSNPSILTVDNVGNVTAKAKGTATITVKTPNGITKSVTITVKERT